MLSPRILSEIYGGHWLIDKQKAKGYLPVIASLMKEVKDPTDYSAEREKNRSKLISINAQGVYEISEYGLATPPEEAPKDSIAVIPVLDVITKYDQFCGPSGTSTKMDLIKRADENPNIKSIILKIDSPGGEANGTQAFANAIKNCTTPVIGFVDDLAASAGYWIASATDIIIINADSAQVGSIGAYTSIFDYNKYWEEHGIKIIDVYAKQSTDKNKGYRDAIEKGDTTTLKEDVSKLTDFFINDVKENRSGKINFEKGDPFTGKLFFADEAIEIGLADEKGDFNYAIEIARKQVQQSNQTHKSNTQAMKKIPFNSAWNAIASKLGREKTDDKELTEADVDKLNTNLEEMGTQLATANSEKEQLTSTVEAKDKEIETLKAANAELSEKLTAKPAAPVAAPEKAKDDISTSNDGVDWTTLNSLPHMKEAMEENNF